MQLASSTSSPRFSGLSLTRPVLPLTTPPLCSSLSPLFSPPIIARPKGAGRVPSWRRSSNVLEPAPRYHLLHQSSDPTSEAALRKKAPDRSGARAAVAAAGLRLLLRLQLRVGITMQWVSVDQRNVHGSTPCRTEWVAPAPVRVLAPAAPPVGAAREPSCPSAPAAASPSSSSGIGSSKLLPAAGAPSSVPAAVAAAAAVAVASDALADDLAPSCRSAISSSSSSSSASRSSYTFESSTYWCIISGRPRKKTWRWDCRAMNTRKVVSPKPCKRKE